MKRCPKCGVENSDDAKFCRECDALFDEEVIVTEAVEQPKVEAIEKKEQENNIKQKSNCYPVTDEELVSVKKAFRFFVKAPKVVLTVALILFGLAGIIFTAIYSSGLFIVIFWIGGSIFALLVYLIMKVSFSYYILSIYYARKNNMDINALREELNKKKK